MNIQSALVRQNKFWFGVPTKLIPTNQRALKRTTEPDADEEDGLEMYMTTANDCHLPGEHSKLYGIPFRGVFRHTTDLQSPDRQTPRGPNKKSLTQS